MTCITPTGHLDQTGQNTQARQTPMRVVVLGAGKIGRTIAVMLHDSGDYRVTLVDREPTHLEGVPQGIAVRVGDPDQTEDCVRLLGGAQAVLNALPFHAAVGVATVAVRLGVHYFDLTEDVAATHAIRRLAEGARSVLMPQCGLAPGFIGVVGNDLAQRFLRLAESKSQRGCMGDAARRAMAS